MRVYFKLSTKLNTKLFMKKSWSATQDPTRFSENNCIKDLAPRQKLPLDSTLELSLAIPVGLSSGLHDHRFQSFHQNNDDHNKCSFCVESFHQNGDHDNNVHSVRRRIPQRKRPPRCKQVLLPHPNIIITPSSSSSSSSSS